MRLSDKISSSNAKLNKRFDEKCGIEVRDFRAQ